MKNLALILIFLTPFWSCNKENQDENPSQSSTVTDVDGNVYKTVKIGNQIWMAENLKTTKYADGTAIPLVTGNANWYDFTRTGPAYCWYNDDITNKNIYGAIYNWPAVMNEASSSSSIPSEVRGVCPTGWHVPSDAEWQVMVDYLIANGYNYDGSTTGNKIGKSLASTNFWLGSDGVGTVGRSDFSEIRNKTGFSAVPAGVRWDKSEGLGLRIRWYSSTEQGPSSVWDRDLWYDGVDIVRNTWGKIAYGALCPLC